MLTLAVRAGLKHGTCQCGNIARILASDCRAQFLNMITNEEYQKALQIVKQYREQCISVIAEIDKNTDKYFELRNTVLAHTLVTDLSNRTLYVLRNNFDLDVFDSVVKDLANVSREELIKCRNFGKKSLTEIDELCKRANVMMRP